MSSDLVPLDTSPTSVVPLRRTGGLLLMVFCIAHLRATDEGGVFLAESV